jgi:phage terminase large subunit
VTEGRGLGERIAERVAGPPPAPPIADPVDWIERRFGVTLWSGQRRIVEAVHRHRQVAVPAAHSVGKSKLTGLLAGYWIGAHQPGSAFVFVTAPRTAQVRGINFREIGRAHRDGNLPGRLTMGQNPEWWWGDELVAVGRSPADRVDPEEAATAMQGIHAEHLLVIADEAAGLPGWVWDAIDSLASNAGAKVLATGNPTIRESRFYDVCLPDSGWQVERISALESPNLTGEPVPASVARNLVSAQWVEGRRRREGTDGPFWRSRIEALFPEVDDDALVDPRWVEDAIGRELPAEGRSTFAVDVGRGGDRTVIAERRGGRISFPYVGRTTDTMEVVGHLTRVLLEAGQGSAVIDEIGVGGGVLDRAREKRLPVRGFNGAERADDPRRFRNRRAQAFWELRELLRDGALSLSDDETGEELAAELLSLSWSVDSGGRILIGAKSDLPRSPDLADAASMAVAETRSATRWVGAVPGREKRDPLHRSLTEAGSGIAMGDDHPDNNWLRRQW